MILKSIGALIASLILTLVLMPLWIDYLRKISFNQSVSEYSLGEYKQKEKTPIMGGVQFILIPIVMTFLFDARGAVRVDNLAVMAVYVGYGLIGFIDDWLIVVKKNNDGLKPWQKFGLQLALAALFFYAYRTHARLEVVLPVTHAIWRLGPFYALLIVLMLSGSSNAVNLTDGMDGLAAGCVICSLGGFLVLAMVQHNVTLSIFISSLIGALVGYLFYNIRPARIFMGDTGSLALGAVLAAIAMVLKQELSLIVIGGVFVIETVCVIIQQVSVKVRGKLVFPYTPIHYAFRLKGYTENQTVHGFWLASFCFAILGTILALI